MIYRPLIIDYRLILPGGVTVTHAALDRVFLVQIQAGQPKFLRENLPNEETSLELLRGPEEIHEQNLHSGLARQPLRYFA